MDPEALLNHLRTLLVKLDLEGSAKPSLEKRIAGLFAPGPGTEKLNEENLEMTSDLMPSQMATNRCARLSTTVSSARLIRYRREPSAKVPLLTAASSQNVRTS